MKKKWKIVIVLLIIALIVGGIIFFSTKKSKKTKDYTIAEVNNYSYFIMMDNNKYGVINTKGETVVNPEYDEIVIPNPEKDIFICYKENNSKVLNSNNEELYTEYESVNPVRLQNVVSDLMYEKSVLTYTEDGKMGVIDFEGNKITDNKYESIEALPYQEGKLLVKQNEKVGVININGYELIECDYDKVEIDGYYQKNGDYKYAGYIVSNTTEEGYRYGYINYDGQLIIEPDCNELSRVTEIEGKDNVYLILARNGQYGVYKNKQEIINCEYQSIRYEKENQIFVIEKSKTYGAVNIDAQTIIPLEYNQIDITGICIYAIKDEETKIFNKNGDEIDINPNTSILNTENENYKVELVSNEDNILYGVIDNDGNEIIPKQYSYIEYLSGNNFIVSNNEGKLGVLDDAGNEKIEMKYNSLQKVEGTDILQATNSDEGVMEFYSKNLEKICDSKTSNIKVKGKYIYIMNEDGTQYINTETNAEEFNLEVFTEHSIFSKRENDLWGFIDRTGNVVVDYKYEKVTELNEFGYAGIKQDGKWGVIDSEGKIIVEPTYEIQESNEVSLDFIGKYYGVEYGTGEIYYTNMTNQK